MLDDRIIVQDRPDYGLAALLQNTKGVDAATMAMMNNGGFGGNYWVWLILLLLWGGNGFGNRGNAQFAELQSQISSNQNANLIMDGIKGNASAISTLASNLNCDFNSLNSAICSVQSAIQNVAAQTGLSGERIINAVNMGDCGIVTAIKEGRRVYRNIQKIIQFLLVGNVAEISTLAIATIFNWNAPLLALHILWVNLATATLPALALGVDPASPNIMKHKPVKTGTVFEKDLVWRVISQGLFVALLTLTAYWIGAHHYWPNNGFQCISSLPNDSFI